MGGEERRPKEDRIKVEPSRLRLKGQPVRIVDGSANPLANTAVLISTALASPREATIIVPPDQKPPAGEPPEDTAKRPGVIVSGTAFNTVLWIVFGITIVCLIIMIVMVITIPTPTPTQARVLDAMLSAFQLGFGAFVGLIGGKQLK
jgi:hypothetical protein